MPSITYTNERGQSIVLGDSAPLLVTVLDGLGGVQNTIHRQKAPGQDGTTAIASSLEERQLVIEGLILAADKRAYRQRLLQAFNPKLSGVLRYGAGETAREIECRAELAPAIPSVVSTDYQQFMITLLCPSPFWLDIYMEREEMADWIGGLQFSLMLPAVFAGRSSRLNRVLHNAGDVDAPLTIEFIGPCSHPRVTNVDTGEYIRVVTDLAANERLVITTHFGNKTVKLRNNDTGEESNAFHLLDLGSTFFQLAPGDNQLSYDADQGKETAKVWLRWRNRYVGV